MEEWRSFLVDYSISNLGRVRFDIKNRYRKATIRRRYKNVHIRGKNYPIHRLVAKYFVTNTNPSEYDIVNHKDSDPFNNHWENLEWCNTKMNVAHCYEKGNHTAIWSENFKTRRAQPNRPGHKRNRKLPLGVKRRENLNKTRYFSQVGNKRNGLVYLGIYDTVEEAAQAVRDWYIKEYGKYPDE